MANSSRLAAFCEKFIQAGWLLALVIAPVYFNIYSSRVFEPDKITLIRTLALAMGAAWLVLRAERWRARETSDAEEEHGGLARSLRAWLKQLARGNPLAIPTLLFLLIYVISTLLSVSPTVSLFGSYQRLQGLYSFLSYFIIFFLAASLIKSRTDIERAVTIALIASFPATFYGIIQHYFLDPLPWIGDVTTRVASNMGNSIFIGAYIILAIPLALGRLIQTSGRAAAKFTTPQARYLFYVASVLSLFAIAAAWTMSFEIYAKNLIENNYTGSLTPDQLTAATGAFNLALLFTILVLLAWVGAAYFFKQRIAPFLLTGLYGLLLAIQIDVLLFSESRGPLIGIAAGLFVFGIVYTIIRVTSRLGRAATRVVGGLVLGYIVFGLVGILFLAIVNIPNGPFASFRNLPYVGRLGQVFEIEGGTGRVRVLIWQGALKLVTPHAPIWSPTTGYDAFNPIRPLVGYGPETMYVAYNQFYPAELGQLESRNATPDRSHNETFDALVTTGLVGFLIENIVFLTLFYYGLKWLGFISSGRDRNIFIATWYTTGILTAIALGLAFGWEFIGVGLPAGMVLGMVIYIAAHTLLRGVPTPVEGISPLWTIALLSLFVSHFIEIHFGIAIVSTRTYFWFFAAVFVALGTRQIAMRDAPAAEAASAVKAPSPSSKFATTGSARRKRARNDAPSPAAQTMRRIPNRPQRVSTAPLITLAFLLGFILATMGFDYITTNNASLVHSGTAVSGIDIVISALTIKPTTAGGVTSFAMLWLFVFTFVFALGVCICEWGHSYVLSSRDWSVAVLLFFVLAFAIFSGFIFYHVILIGTNGAGILDALLTAVSLFAIFCLIAMTVTAITMLFDETVSQVLVSHATNWVVLPVMLIIAAVLIQATNLAPIEADMLYKQAANASGQDAATALGVYQKALALQPQQDYYLLFLGRAYLDDAKNAQNQTQRESDLQEAQQTLEQARVINPYNTDHSANLARLAQARADLTPAVQGKIDAYKQSADYFQQATRLSPNTAHLYDQYAQVLLQYSALLRQNNNPTEADQIHAQAVDEIAKSTAIDSTFCLTYAVRAQAASGWQDRTRDALTAIQKSPQCGDIFINDGLSIAVDALSQAGDQATGISQGTQFEQQLKDSLQANPTLEVYTTLANYYSKAGKIDDAIGMIDGALQHIPETNSDTLKRYQDFRYSLVQLQQALKSAQSAPNDAEAQRNVAQLWLARGQYDFALTAFQKVLEIKPTDYPAQRNVALLLITMNQLIQARQEISKISPTAPTTDQKLWQTLGAILVEVQGGKNADALVQLNSLGSTASQQDYALLSALRALANKLNAMG